MAVVQSVRALEAMRNETDQKTGGHGGQIMPGVTIIIESPGGHQERVIGPAQPQVIEHETSAESG